MSKRDSKSLSTYMKVVSVLYIAYMIFGVSVILLNGLVIYVVDFFSD